MAAAYRGITTDAVTDSSDKIITLAKPSGTIGDDVLVVVLTRTSTKNITPPSGWSTIYNADNCAAYTIVASSQSGDSDFTSDGTYAAMRGAMISISGASVPTVVAGQYNNTYNTSNTCPDVTISGANDLAIWAGVAGTQNARTNTADRGTERADDSASGAFALCVYTESAPGTGAQGAEITLNSSINKKTGLSIAVPAAAASGITNDPIVTPGTGPIIFTG